MTKFRKLKSKDDISIQIAVLGKGFDAKIEMFGVIGDGMETDRWKVGSIWLEVKELLVDWEKSDDGQLNR